MLCEIKASEELIFDVGAHRGEDSAFYLKLGYRVVAIEANPDLVSKLQSRFSIEVASGACVVVPKAIAKETGEVDFFVNKRLSVWGTTAESWAERNRKLGADSDVVSVPAVTLTEILREHGCPQYMKIDIEGADMLCLMELRDTPCRPKYLSIESSKTSWRALLEEFNLLEQLGYKRFQVVGQRNHGSRIFYGKDGKRLIHVFETDSSGPFGPYLSGRWLSKRGALLRYVPIFIIYKLIGDNTSMARVLRRLPVAKKLIERVNWYDTHASL